MVLYGDYSFQYCGLPCGNRVEEIDIDAIYKADDVGNSKNG